MHYRQVNVQVVVGLVITDIGKIRLHGIHGEVIFKTELARMFIDYMHLDVDRDLVLTACLLCNCKKVDNAQKLGRVQTYAKEGADYLLNIGFEPRFCRICEGVNRYSGLKNREPESDILELVDHFGGMMLDRPERAG